MESTPQNSSWAELIRFAVTAALIIIPIRLFIAQPFIVSGASMDPTFIDGDYLIVDELSYHLRQPTRGEVVVFRPPQNNGTYYIKRIIGLPGETVIIKDSNVSIKKPARLADGGGNETFKIEESYIADKTLPDMEKTLGEKEYFVMGDNRESSSDSRVWGALPEKNIKGRALIRVLPLAEFGLLPGKFD